MRLRKRLVATGATIATAAWLAVGGTAGAAFPDFTGCPQGTNPVVRSCLSIQSRDGFLDIKGFAVPIGESFNIRGGLEPTTLGNANFHAPSDGNGIFSKPIQIPGGILGIDFPLPGNAVTARAVLAGPSSGIKVNTLRLSVTTPVKLILSNPLIGPNCRIGTDSNPVVLNLIVGTTSPPAPNLPITGARGRQTFENGDLIVRGSTNVDNAFAVPGASYCGLGVGLINALINAKLRLPSNAGNNTISVVNDVAIGLP
jgi:hypothetical protein